MKILQTNNLALYYLGLFLLFINHHSMAKEVTPGVKSYNYSQEDDPQALHINASHSIPDEENQNYLYATDLAKIPKKDLSSCTLPEKDGLKCYLKF